MTATVTSRVPFWRNVNVLKWVAQLVVVAGAVAIVIWLYGNYTENTCRQNIPTDLDFLDNPAAFQITGNSLSQSAPVRDALVQGLLNTLRVSVVAIVAATVLGTLIGIGRLSSNWIVKKLATVYVEAVRNIPLALFVIASVLVVVLGVFPHDHDAWETRRPGDHLQPGSRWRGTRVLALGFCSIVSPRSAPSPWYGVARWRSSVSDRTGALPRSGLWGGAAFVDRARAGVVPVRATRDTLRLDGRATAGGIRIDPSFFALFLALVIYTASHIAEIVRGSIQAVPLGQGEAADAVALSGFQRMWYIILPQAMRIGIPPIGNQYLNLIKNSSLGAAIGYYDLTLVAQTTVGNGSPAVPVFFLTMTDVHLASRS